MAVLISAIAGRYSSTYTPPSSSAVDLGVMEDPGYRLSFTPAWDRVTDTDAYGAALIEKIWLGFTSVFLDCTSKEWKTGPLRANNPGAAYAASGSTTFVPGLVGRRGSDIVGAVIMTATASTPAASSPATLTIPYAGARGGSTVDWIFGPRHRRVPLAFEVIAEDAGSGVPRYFSST